MCTAKQNKATINYMDIFKLSPTRLRSSLLGKVQDMFNEKYSNGELQITLEISIRSLSGKISIHNKNVHYLDKENAN